MKPSNLHTEHIKLTDKTTPVHLIAGKVVKLLLVIFVMSWISMLSSCVVAVPHERYHRHIVVVEQNYRGERHDNGRHNGWYKHHDHDDHDDHHDHDDHRDRD